MKPTNQSSFRKTSQRNVPGPSQRTRIQKLSARRCFALVPRAIHSGGPYQTRRSTRTKLRFVQEDALPPPARRVGARGPGRWHIARGRGKWHRRRSHPARVSRVRPRPRQTCAYYAACLRLTRQTRAMVVCRECNRGAPNRLKTSRES